MKYLHPLGYECLTKENFWNALKERFPAEVDHFCRWIDEYKKNVRWDKLFPTITADILYPLSGGKKFHDLPIDMQAGIIYRYSNSFLFEEYLLNMQNLMHNPAMAVEAFFSSIHLIKAAKS